MTSSCEHIDQIQCVSTFETQSESVAATRMLLSFTNENVDERHAQKKSIACVDGKFSNEILKNATH